MAGCDMSEGKCPVHNLNVGLEWEVGSGEVSAS